jgi:Icc protein
MILQLTDLHLFSDPAAILKGIPTRESLNDVLRHVRQGIQSGKWTFSHFVITGDLAHDEQHGTYEMLNELLGDWVPRCYFVPGNHDRRDAIRGVFHNSIETNETINFSTEASNWRLIGLDSHVAGELAGHVSTEQLAWLEAELAQHSDQPTILFVHHPPFAIESVWLDKIGLRNSNEFIRVVQSNPQVRVVSTGHVHQQFERRVGNVDFLTTPSTAIQFQPGGDHLVCDRMPPGFRIFKLDGDHHETEVVRLPELSYPPE